MKKIAFTGGGTAGHITPNIALIEELRKEYDILYIGMKNSMEEELIQQMGIQFIGINGGKLRRYFDFKNLTDVFKILLGFIESLLIFGKDRPKLLFSKGGFVSCPVVWAAWAWRIPIIIHESDISPGLANRLALPFARKIAYSFQETERYLQENKRVYTGLPIRKSLFEGDRNKGLKLCNFLGIKPIILIVGGSQGSKYINDIIRENLEELLKKYNICHVTGKGQIDNNLDEKEGYIQFEYVTDELRHLLTMSDMIISRAGATFIFEILALKKLNILIPLSKKVSRGDQILNAKSFEKSHFSKVIQEDEGIDIIEAIENVFQNREIYYNAMEDSDLSHSNEKLIMLLKEFK